jgi:methylated-DNA-[protein]-cysteine S-methyltransferase
LLTRPCAILKETERQLHEYFKGERKRFDIPLRLEGTEFQKKVWLALKSIPFGKTCSYQDQARSIKKPKATRAVGGANGKNPIAVILPCHRVIGKSGRLTGFAVDLSIKEYLLRHEANVLGRAGIYGVR